MKDTGLRKLFWGLLFVLFTFRIAGFDILPDMAGYILFALGIKKLAKYSDYFVKAEKYNYVMIILSSFFIYETPLERGSLQLIHSDVYSTIIGISFIVFRMITFYYLFMGIKEMAERQGKLDMGRESYAMWNQYKLIQIGLVTLFIIIFFPILNVIYFIFINVMNFIVSLRLITFMRKCNESLEIYA